MSDTFYGSDYAALESFDRRIPETVANTPGVNGFAAPEGGPLTLLGELLASHLPEVRMRPLEATYLGVPGQEDAIDDTVPPAGSRSAELIELGLGCAGLDLEGVLQAREGRLGDVDAAVV